MARQIKWSPEAVADRIQILNYWYIKTGSKRYSHYLDDLFKEVISIIKKFPEIGKQYDDFPSHNIRYFTKDYYQIFIN